MHLSFPFLATALLVISPQIDARAFGRSTKPTPVVAQQRDLDAIKIRQYNPKLSPALRVRAQGGPSATPTTATSNPAPTVGTAQTITLADGTQIQGVTNGAAALTETLAVAAYTTYALDFSQYVSSDATDPSLQVTINGGGASRFHRRREVLYSGTGIGTVSFYTGPNTVITITFTFSANVGSIGVGNVAVTYVAAGDCGSTCGVSLTSTSATVTTTPVNTDHPSSVSQSSSSTVTSSSDQSVTVSSTSTSTDSSSSAVSSSSADSSSSTVSTSDSATITLSPTTTTASDSSTTSSTATSTSSSESGTASACPSNALTGSVPGACITCQTFGREDGSTAGSCADTCIDSYSATLSSDTGICVCQDGQTLAGNGLCYMCDALNRADGVGGACGGCLQPANAELISFGQCLCIDGYYADTEFTCSKNPVCAVGSALQDDGSCATCSSLNALSSSTRDVCGDVCTGAAVSSDGYTCDCPTPNTTFSDGTCVACSTLNMMDGDTNAGCGETCPDGSSVSGTTCVCDAASGLIYDTYLNECVSPTSCPTYIATLRSGVCTCAYHDRFYNSATRTCDYCSSVGQVPAAGSTVINTCISCPSASPFSTTLETCACSGAQDHWNSISATCDTCPSTNPLSSTTNTCTCPQGQSWSDTTRACACPSQSSISKTDSTTCTCNSSGQYFDAPTAACHPCSDKGMISSGGVCVACPADAPFSSTTKTCTCTSPQVWNAGLGRCFTPGR